MGIITDIITLTSGILAAQSEDPKRMEEWENMLEVQTEHYRRQDSQLQSLIDATQRANPIK